MSRYACPLQKLKKKTSTASDLLDAMHGCAQMHFQNSDKKATKERVWIDFPVDKYWLVRTTALTHGFLSSACKCVGRERTILCKRRRSFHVRPAVVDNGNSQVIQASVPCSSTTTFMPGARRPWASQKQLKTWGHGCRCGYPGAHQYVGSPATASTGIDLSFHCGRA